MADKKKNKRPEMPANETEKQIPLEVEKPAEGFIAPSTEPVEPAPMTEQVTAEEPVITAPVEELPAEPLPWNTPVAEEKAEPAPSDTPLDDIPELNPEKEPVVEAPAEFKAEPEPAGESAAEVPLDIKPEEKIAEVKEKKEKKPSKFKEFIKKHKVPVIIAAAVLVVALAIVITLVIANKDLVRIGSAEDFINKGTDGKTTYVLTADVTVEGDLTIPHGMNIDLNKNTLTVTGNLIYGADAADSDIYIGDKKGVLYLNNGGLRAALVSADAPAATLSVYAPVTANADINVKILRVKNTWTTVGEGSIVIDAVETVTFNEAVTLTGDAPIVQITAATVNILKDMAAAGSSASVVINAGVLQVEGGITAMTVTVNNSGNSGATSNINGAIPNALIINNSSITIGANAALGTVTLDAASNLDIYGDVAVSLTGGALVIFRSGSSCPLTLNTAVLHIYENANITEMVNVGSVLFYVTLEAPRDVTIVQEGSALMCYISEVNNADHYIVTIDGTDLAPSTNVVDITASINLPGEHTIAVKAVSDSELFLDSPSTSVVYIYSIKLDTPEITFDDSDGYKVNFEQIPFASYYKYSVNNGEYFTFDAIIEGQPISIDITDKAEAAGVYVVKVIAYGANMEAYEPSETATLSFIRKVALDTVMQSELPVSIVKSGTVLTLDWDAVENGEYYSVYINDVLAVKTKNTSVVWTLGDLDDNAAIKVIADAHGYYLASAPASTVYQYETLAAPVLTGGSYISGDNIVIDWSAVENATAYKVYKDGVQAGEDLTATIFTTAYTPANAGTYTVQAVAEYYRPGVSADAVVAVPTLAAPVIEYGVVETTVTITWTAVPHAAEYKVYAEGELEPIATVTDTNYSGDAAVMTGNTYYVIASGNSYIDSTASNTVTIE